MNRRTTLAIVTLALALTALPLAQGSAGDAQAGRPMGPDRRGPGGPGRPLVPGLAQLDLTDAQKQQLRALMEEERQPSHPGGPAREAEQALNAAVFAEAPNPQAIESARAAIHAARTAELDRRIELMQRVAQILTPAQRQQLATQPVPGGPRGRGQIPRRH